MADKRLFIATVSILALLVTGTTTNAQAAPPAYVNDCGYPAYKPQSITQYCADAGTGVVKIKWTSWTSTRATGTGSYYVNLCEPNCADGKRAEVPVKLRLSELFEYKGRKVLKNLDIQAVSGRELPDGTAGFTWDVAEFAVKIDWEN